MSTTLPPRRRRPPAPQSESSLPKRRVTWGKAAPAEIRRAASRNLSAAEWTAWTAYLEVRSLPRLPRIFRGTQSPFLLGTEGTNVGGGTDLLVLLWRAARGKRRAAKEAAEQLSSWLVEAEGAPASIGYALECLAWTWALPNLAQYVPADTWWELFWHLLSAAGEAAAAQVAMDPLAAMLLSAELPLSLAILFPEIDDCQTGAEPAVMALGRMMTEPAAAEVMYTAARLHVLRPTLACWLRAESLCLKHRPQKRGQPPKGARREARRERRRAARRLVLAVMRWTRGDGGSIVLESAQTASRAAVSTEDATDLLAAAVKHFPSGDVQRAWREWRLRNGQEKKSAPKHPRPGAPYEASGTAVLRSHWGRSAAILATAFDGWPTTLEFSVERQLFVCGAWDAEIRSAGQAFEALHRPWDIVCWESGRKEQWLELETELGHGVRLERGMLLAPQDQFLLLIDAVVGPPGSKIEYLSRLPLAPDMHVKKEKETREITLRGEHGALRVLPLALSEWKSDPRWGEFSAGPSHLELRQHSKDGALCAALWIDYSPKRRKAPLTWRQLAVGEERLPVPRDVAVGYRVQIGIEQWLVYRALRSCANRTVLGQNLATEFKVGRFLPDGAVKTIVEIE